MEVQEQVIAIIAEKLKALGDDTGVTLATELADLGDSLMKADLVTGIEDAFDLDYTEDDVLHRMKTVQDLVVYVPQAIEILAQRDAVVAEAASWIDTPFAHDAAVKGIRGGCDCSHLGISYSAVLGVKIEWPKDPLRYTANPQWFLHPNPQTGEFDEIYLDGLIANGFVEIDDGRSTYKPYKPEHCIHAKKKPGDIIISKIVHLFAHGGIIEKWPTVIQSEPSINGRGKVCRATAESNYFLCNRSVRYFSWKGWH